jgi:integrase
MSGHIRRRGEQSWELKYEAGTDPRTGKRVTRYQSFKGTKREAQAELVRLMDAVRRGDYVDPSKLTLGEFLDRWERDWAALNVAAKTRERYGELLRVHVRHNLGCLPIQKLQPVHLAELYAKLLREGRPARGDEKESSGLAPRTVGHVHRVLHKVLTVAVEWGVIQRNPASIARPPKVSGDGEIEILSEERAREVLQRLHDQPLYRLVLLGLTTGMRRGELLALRWCDINFDEASLRVERSLEETKAGLHFKPPKTKAGRRTIGLPSSVVAELRAHWKEHQELRLRFGMGKAPDDALVFPRRDGSPRSPNGTTKEWLRALRELKLPEVTLHALRHTHASQLIASGMDVLTISRRLGHGSPTITLGVYAHLFRNNDREAARLMEAAYGAITEREQN